MKRLFFFLGMLLLGVNNLVAQKTDVVKAAIDSIRIWPRSIRENCVNLP